MYECKAARGGSGYYRPYQYAAIADDSIESIWKNQSDLLRKRRSEYASVQLYRLDTNTGYLNAERELSLKESIIVVPAQGCLRVREQPMVMSAVLMKDGSIRYVFDRDLLNDTIPS